MRNAFFSLLTSVVAFVVVLAVGEGLVRAYLYYKYHIKNSVEAGAISPITIGTELGWESTPNYAFHGERVDAAGQRYRVDITTDGNGFRMFGQRGKGGKEPQKKIFFIGDSFTQALEVSDNKTYYAQVAERLPCTVYAYGTGGFGTLQEYMALDKYEDRIAPDIVVLQYCYNDFYNNSYALELRSAKNSNSMVRPYYTSDDRIVYRLPMHFPRLRRLANDYADTFKLPLYLLYKVDKLNARFVDTVEKEIEAKGKGVPAYAQSVETTGRIFEKIKRRLPPKTQFYVFAVDDKQPYYADLATILRKAGIPLITGVAEAVRAAEAAGKVTRADDGVHWNETGHAIAAGKLVDFFAQKWQ